MHESKSNLRMFLETDTINQIFSFGVMFFYGLSILKNNFNTYTWKSMSCLTNWQHFTWLYSPWSDEKMEVKGTWLEPVYIFVDKIHLSQTRIFIISYKEYLGVGNKEKAESNQAEYTLNLKTDFILNILIVTVSISRFESLFPLK